MTASLLPSSIKLINGSWRRSLLLFAGVGLLLHLIWEALHFPLYTLWATGTWGDILYAIVHCTIGDLMISMASLLIALLLMSGGSWPVTRRRRVLIMTVALGLGYTVFSEWLNVDIRQSWAYSELMPVVPFINTGLSPLMQWLVIPSIQFALMYRQADH